MLVFTRKLNEAIVIGDGIEIRVLRVGRVSVRLGVTPEINAVCTVLIGVVATGVVVTSIFAKRQDARRKADERLAAAGD